MIGRAGGALALAAIIIGVVGCGSSGGSTSSGSKVTPSAAPQPHVTGTLTLSAPEDVHASGKTCFVSSSGGYSDIDEGAQVTLYNESNTVLATTQLEAGTVKIDDPVGTCRFAFDLGAVPPAKFYSVEVSHRGKITDSAAELARDGWKFELTLGH